MRTAAIRYLVVDSDPGARAQIRSYMENLCNFEFAGECGRALQAIDLLFRRHVDLLFLHTELPDMSAVQLLGALSHLPHVILTSDSSEYAQAAFEMDVTDYLLKPYTLRRFVKAVNKCRPSPARESLWMMDQEKIPEEDFIYVEEKGRVIKLFVRDICYVESIHEQLRIHTEGGQISVRSSLNNLEQLLSDWPFARIHKDLLIAIPKIRSFSFTTVDLDHASLNIGRHYKERFFHALRYDWDLN